MQKELIIKVLLTAVSLTILGLLYYYSKFIGIKFLKLFMSQDKAEDNVVYFIYWMVFLLFVALGLFFA